QNSGVRAVRQSAYNGHFELARYHPMLLFNRKYEKPAGRLHSRTVRCMLSVRPESIVETPVRGVTCLVSSELPMPSSVYYFRPFAQPAILRRLAIAYPVIPVDRGRKRAQAWKLPAVFIADANKNDMALLEPVTPRSDSWYVICLLDGDALPESKLNDKVFAILPRRLSAASLEKTVEKAFENLRSREESRKARQEL